MLLLIIRKNICWYRCTHHNRQGFLYLYSKCEQMYGLLPYHYWQEFFALVTWFHLQWGKNAPTKNGSPKFKSILLCLVLPTTNGKNFLYFAINCKQVYSWLPHHYWQGFFVLDCCLVTYEAKMLPLELVSQV